MAGIEDTSVRLNMLVQAGKMLLESGAATYRVEETLQMLGRGLLLSDVEVFVTPTGFILSAAGPSHCLTRVCRVTHLGVDMNRISALNRLSREAASDALMPEQIAARLEKIQQRPSLYPTWLVVLGVAVACGAFAALLGGGWREFLATVLGAALSMILRVALRPARLIPLMVIVLAAFAATAGSVLGCRALACPSPDLAPIAAALQLVPGVPLVTAVIDLATGDIISGMARGAYAALMAAGIALGMLLFLAWGFMP